jgi:hypothetical protein
MAARLLGGLFDRPLKPLDEDPCAVDPLDPACPTEGGGEGGGPGIGPCEPGFYQALDGSCISIDAPIVLPTPPGITSTTSPTPANITIQNTVNVTDNAVQSISDAVTSAVTSAAQNAADIAKQTASTIASGINSLAQNIWNGIQAAFSNIGSLLSGIASVVWDNIKGIFSTIWDNIASFLTSIRDFLSPILSSISDTLHSITTEIQNINDTLIQPIVTFYNTTVKTIASLTTAIEQDLHDGLSGLLKIPSDIAGAMGTLDASLQRTVQQMGTVNEETIKSGITFGADALPTPFGKAINASLAGGTLTDKLKTTFTNQVNLSSESLQAISSEAISGIGTLLSEILHIITQTFETSFNQLHADWTSVGSVFVALLDGILGLLTTFTAMGALAGPLIQAAEQEANKLVPTSKLDPSTVIEAMKRGFLSAEDGLKEIQTAGYDSTRIKVLQDLSVYLADVNTALDWWYRGIIEDADLAANMKDHGISDVDQQAIKAGSVYLPTLADFIKWLNFGFIDQDEFILNLKQLRYDSTQIGVILASYQDRISPQSLAQLSGLLDNSSIGWINNTTKIPPPDYLVLAGQKAGFHPELVQSTWLAHWNIPPVQSFIQAYFRGLRTLTELQARFAIDNIPSELWDELIQVNRPLIPFRSVNTLLKGGQLTHDQAQSILAAHGFDLPTQQILLSTKSATATTAQAAATAALHTLSVQNARTLWEDGALSDDQYTTILEAHGYNADTAKAQLGIDTINEHIKKQKQTLADTLALVEAGQLDLDTAMQNLTQSGFTSAQVAAFQHKVIKATKVNAKHPSIADLTKFLKAQLINADQYRQELIAQGWVEPWVTAFMGLVSTGQTPTSPA